MDASPLVLARDQQALPLPRRVTSGGAHLRPLELRSRIAVMFLLVAAALLGMRLAADEAERRAVVGPLPDVAAPDLVATYLDEQPVSLTTTASWQKVAHVASRRAVRSDVTLWRRMHIDDWDTVPEPLRAEGLDAMLARYGHVLADPDVWDHMGPLDWDVVPQPIRALAFRHMVEYWSGHYQVGVARGIPRRTMADTLAAIVMSESWFEHRAVTVNPWGNRDLGVAQASDTTRQRLAALYRAGVVDVMFEDEEYFDPWKGTRFVAIWMALMLDETGGDLEGAVRAYHRGSGRAGDEHGQTYYDTVMRRMRRFIRNDGTSNAWDHLWRRDEALVRASQPWRPHQGGG